MGNIISNNKVSEHSLLQLSNGATDVFISLLALSGSALAKRENEILLITCIASSDQNVIGRGIVGFDISDLPWSTNYEDFLIDKKFLLNTVDRVISTKDWHKLNYTPDVDSALSSQSKFMSMIDSLQNEHVSKFNRDKFCLLPEVLGRKCNQHGVYLHKAGCVVCNEAKQ